MTRERFGHCSELVGYLGSMVALSLAALLALIPASNAGAAATYVQKLDIYRYSVGGTVSFTHTYDGSADPIGSATLTVVADDVDGPGNGLDGEQDRVYLNGHYLGLLNDFGYYTNWGYYPGPGNPSHPDQITTTVFELDSSWIEPNMPVNVYVEGSWGVEIETSTITVTPLSPTPTATATATATPTPTPRPGVGGRVLLPAAAVAAESGAAAEGSGWTFGAYAALVGVGAAAAIGIGGWYARRRWLR